MKKSFLKNSPLLLTCLFVFLYLLWKVLAFQLILH